MKINPIVVIGPIPGIPQVPDSIDTVCDDCGKSGHMAPSTNALLLEEPTIKKVCFACGFKYYSEDALFTGVKGGRDVLASSRKPEEITLDDKNVCDFCSAPNPPWLHTSAPFSADVLAVKKDDPSDTKSFVFNSDEYWRACSACHSLVVSGNRRGLLTRTVRQYSRRFRDKSVPEGLTDSVAELQSGFWAGYKGQFEFVGESN